MEKYVVCAKCGALVKVLIDCTCENCGIKCCGEHLDHSTTLFAYYHLIHTLTSYLLNLLNKLISSSIVSYSPFSKASGTQVYKWFSSIYVDKLLIEFLTADNCTNTSLQYASASIIFLIPLICPPILFRRLIIIFLSLVFLFVFLLQQLFSIYYLLTK